MIEYDVYPSKTMFKTIYMHTKSLKHTKNMQILTNYIKKNTIFSKFHTDDLVCKHFSKTPEVIICKNESSRCPEL